MAEFEHLEEMVVGLYDRGLESEPKNRIFDIGTSKILKSGIWSPYLINMRPALSVDYGISMSAEQQVRIKTLMLGSMCFQLDEIKKERNFQHIYGEPEAGTPLASALAAIGGYSLLWKRVIAKPGYGSHQLLEGVHNPGEVVAQVDDVVTLGDTKREADTFLRECGLESSDVDVFTDREQGGKSAVEAMGLHLRSAIGAKTLFTMLHDNGRLTSAEHTFLIDYTNLTPPPRVEPTDHPWKSAA